jgi:hypothetical protein
MLLANRGLAGLSFALHVLCDVLLQVVLAEVVPVQASALVLVLARVLVLVLVLARVPAVVSALAPRRVRIGRASWMLVTTCTMRRPSCPPLGDRGPGHWCGPQAPLPAQGAPAQVRVLLVPHV